MATVGSSIAGGENVSFLPISCSAKSEKVDLILQPTNELKVLDVQEIDSISVIDKVESRYKVKINGEISLVEITSLDCK
jgi:hypothetical protein